MTNLNKILDKEDYEFYKEYMKEYKNMMNGQENIMFTNTGIHSYSNLTVKKVKNITKVGIFYNVSMDKIKDNVTFLHKSIIDRYPMPLITFAEMNNLKTLFIEYIGCLNLFDQHKYDFFLNLPNNLEILIVRIPDYMQPEEYFLMHVNNLPLNLKYLIFDIPAEPKYSINVFKRIKLPLNCLIYYSQSNMPNMNENLIKII